MLSVHCFLVLLPVFVCLCEGRRVHLVYNSRYRNHGTGGVQCLNVSEIIQSEGYPCEEYDVHTEDGYILNIQRIPHGRNERLHDRGNRPVVLLQHGLLSSSADFVNNGVATSLGFVLAEAGFDVWLANSRGNTYALRHETLSKNDERFWQFSWDEMAAYDLPATVDKVLELTGAVDLVYVGFSQGTQIAFARLSTDVALSKKIRLFIAMAPVAYIDNLISPLRYLAPFADDLEFLFTIFGVKDFLPSNWVFHILAKDVCGREIPSFLCENTLFLFGGFDYRYFNMSRIPYYICNSPAGTSVRNIIHYAQSIKSGNFQMFNFGREKNIKRYNQPTPPIYHPQNISVPIVIYSGGRDWLAVPSDVSRLASQLEQVVKHNVIEDWEHLDFVWATNTYTACYEDMIREIKQFYNIVW